MLLLASALATRAAEPALGRLDPQGGQRGTDVDVLMRGQRLGDGPYQILFCDFKSDGVKSFGMNSDGVISDGANGNKVIGIKANGNNANSDRAIAGDAKRGETVGKKSGIEVGDIKKIDAKRVQCTFRLGEDCPLGRHALRLRTASGLSNLVTFHVSNLQEIKETAPNNSTDQPQEIAWDVVVNGVVKAGETDVFALEVAAGERLSVEIEGLRLGRTLFDPVIELQDEAGVVLAHSDDEPAAQQDAFVSMRAVQTGTVLILVREAAYRGSDAATYRLHVGHFPRPSALFPPAAVAGQPAELRWIGDTFEDSTPVTVEVPQTDDPIYEIHAADKQGFAPSGLPLYLSSTTPALEIEPNNRRQVASPMTAPGLACGVISEPADRDFFRFSMKKNQQFDFRVRARELRSPLDTVLRLYGPQGKTLKGNDDDRGQPDSYLRFQAPADGEYTLGIEDRLLRGRDNMVYAVEITKPSPIAQLQLDERRRYQAQVINIPRGGRTAAMMTVKRLDFGGPLQIDYSNLPEGSQAEAVALAANFNRVPVLFSATAEAELGATLATVTARLTETTQPISSRFRQQTWLVRGRNNVHVWSHYANRAAVAVTAALPYSIRVVEPKAPLVQGGSMELQVVAEREEGFEKAIAVRTIYNPPGVSTNQSRSIPKAELTALIPITANAKARIGDWKIAFLGKTSVGGPAESSSQLATLRIVAPYFDLKLPTLTVRQGETAKMVIPLDHRTPFAGDAKLQLLRLSPGVTADTVTVNSGSESAVFQLTIAKDARIGRHRGVGCQAELAVEGEPVQYSQGYVELCVDPSPPTKSAASEQGVGGKAS